MSYPKTKQMNLEDGQTLLAAVDGKMSGLKSAVDQTKADIITVADSESSAIKTFPDGADDQPMAVQIAIEPIQSGTGDPSPTNVRPITGWTGANVLVRGKNLIPNGIELANYIKGLFGSSQIDTTNKTVSFSPVAAEGFPFLLYGEKAVNGRWYPYKTNTPYTFIFKVNSSSSSGRINMGVSYTDGTNNGGFTMGQVVNGYIVWTSSSNKTVKSFYAGVYGGTTTLWYDEIGVFEGTVTLEEYESYKGNTYPITFPSETGTVYGGTLTVNKDGTGSLVVDRDIVDMGTLTWHRNATTGFFWAIVSSMKIGAKLICENYKYYNVTYLPDLPNGCIWNRTNAYNAKNIVVNDTAYSDASSFKSAMSNVMLVYTLATPVTYGLTDIEVIKTILGLNNVWSDTGNILSVDYPADTKLYVDQVTDKLTAAQRLMELIITTNREDGMVATKAYSQGNLMIVSGALYKATTSIANGATLTVDTNITATTVAAELAALA